MRKNKKAFTLIELIAVLVILALIALIVTPLVMNIVKKAKDSANKRSVDAYGKAVELGVATYLLDNGDYPTDISSLTIEYSGNEVVCNTQKLNEDGSIYLSECSVNGTEVKDSNTDDGYYHCGKTSAEAGYQVYNIGDVVTYNGMNFYVIEASDENSDRVTLLKEEPLTIDEVNMYGIDENGVNHVNKYTYSSVGTAYDSNGYGGIAYYTSETCGLVNFPVSTGCITDYDQSEVKYVVDSWAIDKLNTLDLTTDSLGYKTRLITIEDLTNNLGYAREDGVTNNVYDLANVPLWVYNSNYSYWTMSIHNTPELWCVNFDGNLVDASINSLLLVRPVITLSKSAI